MIPRKNQHISFLELIITATILTVLLIFQEKSWLNNIVTSSPVVNVPLEQIK